MSDFQVKEIVEEALRCGQSHKNNGGGCCCCCCCCCCCGGDNSPGVNGPGNAW